MRLYGNLSGVYFERIPTGITQNVDDLLQSKNARTMLSNTKFIIMLCHVNLGKLATINREIRAYAKKANLKASWTDYRQWAVKKKHGHKPQKPRLRFSKSGDEQIERLYATHYINEFVIKKSKENKALAENKDQ